MKCHVCGGELRQVVTDMPFKADPKRIVILKDLPIRQCESCREYLIDDPVMEQVEQMLAMSDQHAELEIVRYAA